MQFKEISGVVLGSETWSQTHVRGSSQGVSYKGIGSSSGRTTSTVTNVSQLWLQLDDGREVAVRVNPDKFATREGHRVSMLVAAKRSGPSATIAAFNHSTGEKHREGGLALIGVAIMMLIFMSWMPVVLAIAFPPVGIIALALFAWMEFYLVVTGVRITSSGSAFLGKMVHRDQPASIAPVGLEAA